MSQDSEEEVPRDEADDSGAPASDDVPDNPLITAASRGDDPLGMFATDGDGLTEDHGADVGHAAGAGGGSSSVGQPGVEPGPMPEFELLSLDELPPAEQAVTETGPTSEPRAPEVLADRTGLDAEPAPIPGEMGEPEREAAEPGEPAPASPAELAPSPPRIPASRDIPGSVAEASAHPPFEPRERLVRPAPRREREETRPPAPPATDSRPPVRPPVVAAKPVEREAVRPLTETRPPAGWGPTPDVRPARDDRTPPQSVAGWRRHLRSMPVLIAAAVIVVAAALFGGWRLVRSFSQPPATPVPQQGKLTVDSRPTGAQVEIDGVARGTTPVALVLKAGKYVMRVGGANGREIAVVVAAGGEVAHHVELAEVRTRLRIATVPAGAAVRVDGQARGNSPLDLEDVAPGPHTLTVDAAGATVRREVDVRPGTDNSVVISVGGGGPTTGWVTVTSPFDVDVYEGSRFVGRSRDGQMLFVSGPHDLTLANADLGYKDTSRVNVAAGATATIRVQPRTGQLSVNATPWAQVYLDNQSIGETPIANYAVAIGPHEIRLVHPQLGERRQAVTITLTAPTRVGIDLTKK